MHVAHMPQLCKISRTILNKSQSPLLHSPGWACPWPPMPAIAANSQTSISGGGLGHFSQRQRQGGLRTNTLVALGAAAFVDIGMHLNGNAGATQIIVYVVSGVGFIGAGVIMKQGGNVWGLNTAATLWCSAAVGACAGADLAIEAILLTGLVLAGNTLLRPLVNTINRASMNEQ